MRLAEIEAEVRGLIDSAEYARALRLLRETMESAFYASRGSGAFNLGSPVLDRLCKKMGDRYRGVLNASLAVADHDVYLATELYRHGGHTGLIGDYIAAAGDRNATVLLTDVLSKMLPLRSDVTDRLGRGVPPRILRCESGDDDARLAWIVQQLRKLRPARVFLFCHPQDCVGIAAGCAATAIAEVAFVHIVDRNPGFGPFIDLEGFRHIDVTPFNYWHCRSVVRPDNAYFPLTAAAAESASNPTARGHTHNGLTTVTSGSVEKFSLSYRVSYPDFVTHVLALTGGTHIHVGQLPEAFLEAIDTALVSHGLRGDRFSYIPHVPCLRSWLRDQQPDIYCGSFPVRGARASIDAMAAAIPTVWHVESQESFYHDTHLKYPDASVWENLDDVAAILKAADRDWISRHSTAAFTHFRQHHRPELLSSALANDAVFPPAPRESFFDSTRKLAAPRSCCFESLLQ